MRSCSAIALCTNTTSILRRCHFAVAKRLALRRRKLKRSHSAKKKPPAKEKGVLDLFHRHATRSNSRPRRSRGDWPPTLSQRLFRSAPRTFKWMHHPGARRPHSRWKSGKQRNLLCVGRERRPDFIWHRRLKVRVFVPRRHILDVGHRTDLAAQIRRSTVPRARKLNRLQRPAT